MLKHVCRLALLAGLAGASPGAWAFEPDIPTELISESDAYAIRLRQRLAELPASADKEDRAGLAAFYQERSGRPVWLESAAALQRARELAAEIRRADDWGLKASAFELPDLAGVDLKAATEGPEEGRAKALERAVDAEIKLGLAALKYARHARGGRFNPADLTRNLDVSPQVYDPASVMASLAQAADPGAYLRKLHPRHAQFEKLRQLYLATRKPGGEAQVRPTAATVRLQPGPTLRPGQSHPQVAQLRERLGVPAEQGGANYFDDELADAVAAFQRSQGMAETGVVSNAVRTALNGGSGGAATGSAAKILANMERWRYVPDDMGKLHVWVNIPEFMVRVVKDGRVIHAERIVAGKTDTQTVVFSAKMEEVIFNPSWNVPNSIKIKEIQPHLVNSTAIMQRQGLKVKYGGRDIDPASVSWDTVDIRNFHFYQPPGGGNVLGIVKFSFPNKHDIYMHDTPSKSLFNSEVRTFSHGCMRVREPRKLAEVLLAEDKGWDSSRVGAAIAAGGENRIPLARKVPVHVTYFTAWVDEAGKPHFRNDIYGHDGRITAALDGKPVQLIAQDDPALAQQRSVQRAREMAQVQRQRRQSYGSYSSSGPAGFLSWLLN